MSIMVISENKLNEKNIFYMQSELSELLTQAKSQVKFTSDNDRCSLKVDIPDYYSDIVGAEIKDKISEIIAINYKYNYFKDCIKLNGLTQNEREILLTSLIAADLDDDKKYVYDKLKRFNEIAIDGFFNFRLGQLKKKWEDVVSYVPVSFINSQLKEFVSYLVESKSKKTYIDNGNVYDSHYKRLNRSALLNGFDDVKIIREVLLSNCGFVSLAGNIPKEDEFYLKEFFSDKISFSDGYFC